MITDPILQGKMALLEATGKTLSQISTETEIASVKFAALEARISKLEDTAADLFDLWREIDVRVAKLENSGRTKIR
jgi:hypothetical protein